MAEPAGKFTAEELAEAAGISLRTVRYYVQEEIIDPPFGRGPGRHFGDRHLLQIRRARLLQDSGFDLETIRDRAGGKLSLDGLHVAGLEGLAQLQKIWGLDVDKLDFKAAMAKLGELKGARAGAQSPATKSPAAKAPAKPPSAEPGDETRIPIIDGVDLTVRKDVAFPSPKALVQLAFAIRKAFEEADE